MRGIEREPRSEVRSQRSERLDGVSPYQCVPAKISVVGRRSAEPVWGLEFGDWAWELLGSWELGFGRGQSWPPIAELRSNRECADSGETRSGDFSPSCWLYAPEAKSPLGSVGGLEAAAPSQGIRFTAFRCLKSANTS